MFARKGLGISVDIAARDRIKWVFERFERVYLSFSAGKDSTVMLDIAAAEARRSGKRFALLLIDLEAQYSATIDFAEKMFVDYADCVDPYWIALPILLRNAVSQFHPRWMAWDPEQREKWVRQPPSFAITDPADLPFFRQGCEFEEFVTEFGRWYAGDKTTACLVGIRAAESLNRYRTMVMDKETLDGRRYTTWLGDGLWNVYPIYDWRTSDIWVYHARTGRPYNRVYDLMHKAGLSPAQMRICQPYGDDQRKGLHLFHVLEPSTWSKVVARVNGANTGALYANETGVMMGRIQVNKPAGHTWESYAKFLLASMPDRSREHFENKIAVFLKWWNEKGYPIIPDEVAAAAEAARKAPSWRRICKTLLKNDWWCKGLSFGQTKSTAYDNYMKVMKNRRSRWGI